MDDREKKFRERLGRGIIKVSSLSDIYFLLGVIDELREQIKSLQLEKISHSMATTDEKTKKPRD